MGLLEAYQDPCSPGIAPTYLTMLRLTQSNQCIATASPIKAPKSLWIKELVAAAYCSSNESCVEPKQLDVRQSQLTATQRDS